MTIYVEPTNPYICSHNLFFPIYFITDQGNKNSIKLLNNNDEKCNH